MKTMKTQLIQMKKKVGYFGKLNLGTHKIWYKSYRWNAYIFYVLSRNIQKGNELNALASISACWATHINKALLSGY